MFRKFTLTLCAAAALGTVALMPTAASARHGGHGGFHGGFHGHAVARSVGFAHAHPRFAVRHFAVRHAFIRQHVRHRFVVRHYAYGSCLVRRVVATPVGPRVRLIDRCLHPRIAVYHAPYYR